MPSRHRATTLATLLLVAGLSACSGDAPQTDADTAVEVPTNPEARTAFEAGQELWTTPQRTRAQADQAIAEYARAAELEPDFFLAHAYLAEAQAWAYQNWDRSPDAAAQAKVAAERAVELAPDRSEAHGALASYNYRIAKDYPVALEHYSRAAELAPDDAYPARMAGYVARRANRWDDAVRLLEAARELGVNRASEWDLGNTYLWLGRWDEARAAYRRAQELAPDHWQPPHSLAWVDIQERGDVSALEAYLADIDGGFVGNRWWLAMVDGDWGAALAVLDTEGADPLSGQYGITPRALLAGLAHRRMGDEDAARASFEEARSMMAAAVEETPDDPRPHMALGLALAGLGMADEAVAAGQQGLELIPPERDAMIGLNNLWWMAEIYATAGDTEMALETLETFREPPRPAGLSAIGMDAWLYTLAEDPRFVALVGGA
jgi:tetratricopeptide (TPR) repeat protein